MGWSWGGFESLIVPVDLRAARTATTPAFGGPLLRLHIGLEDVSDLQADLSSAFDRLQEDAG
jgi:cystathionine beta-lyase